MSDLSISELQEKLEQVKKDLAKETGRKFEVLSEYKEYLEDEIQFLKREQRDSK
jgi:hypothetical protein